MTERLGPEAMRDLVSSFLATSLAEVDRYGGTAPQFTGDGFMALFGAALTRRNMFNVLCWPPWRSGELSGEQETSTSLTKWICPCVSASIHGRWYFGPVGDRLPMDSTAIGDTANVAARLEQAAEPATILLSEATYQLAQAMRGSSRSVRSF